MNSRPHFILLLLTSWLISTRPVPAAFQPIALAPDSYNQDMIVEKSAPPPVVPVTTASMEQGITNRGFSWFEQGYIADWPVTGLPPAGSILTSLQSPDHQYQMPVSYQQANAVLIDSVCSNATITLLTPTNCAALSFLTSSGVAENILRYTVRYREGGIESGTWISPNWYSQTDPAWVTSGRIEVTTFVNADVTAYNPRLYSVDVPLANMVSPVVSVDLSWAAGNGHTAIFAISGAPALGAEFLPLAISGYKEDLVVEAGAIHPGYLDTNTTATMDSGSANTRFTWYEQGYYPNALETGLPAAGSLVSSESEPDHWFQFPGDYCDKNAVLLDAACTTAMLTLSVPTSCSALSFLTASAQGPATNQCVIRHENGVVETNYFVSPDWLGSNGPPAFTARGRVSVSTKIADRVDTDGPRLFAVDVPVVYTNSPVVAVGLARVGGRTDSHAVILALSGAVSTAVSIPPTLLIEASAEGRIMLRSNRPGRVQSCANLADVNAAWREEGPIEQSLTLSLAASDPARFYRLVTSP